MSFTHLCQNQTFLGKENILAEQHFLTLSCAWFPPQVQVIAIEALDRMYPDGHGKAGQEPFITRLSAEMTKPPGHVTPETRLRFDSRTPDFSSFFPLPTCVGEGEGLLLLTSLPGPSCCQPGVTV